MRILVVGAGVAGLALAGLSARVGAQTVVVDRLRFATMEQLVRPLVTSLREPI
jgi:flavin-dependent dehydrogenase